LPDFTLADGRNLRYAIYGDESGYPVIYCHGFPASRIEAGLFTEQAKASGVCLIAPDRPGYGGSDFLENRGFMDWPSDVSALADHRHLDQYAVLGISGGGPYALSCGVMPDSRLKKIAVVCALGPMDQREAIRDMGLPARVLIGFARAYPRLATGVYSVMVGPLLHRFPRAVIAILNRAAPEVDHVVLDDEKKRAIYIQAFQQAFSQSGRGPARDLVLYTHPWDFSFSDVKPTINLWHGEADRTVPAEMGHNYARFLPHCKARFLPDEGHFSLPLRIIDDVFATLKAETQG